MHANANWVYTWVYTRSGISFCLVKETGENTLERCRGVMMVSGCTRAFLWRNLEDSSRQGRGAVVDVQAPSSVPSEGTV